MWAILHAVLRTYSRWLAQGARQQEGCISSCCGLACSQQSWCGGSHGSFDTGSTDESGG